ncbi:Calcium-binding protein CP1 [Linum perenne]
MCPSGTALDATAAAPELKSAFDVLDADRDGKISSDDLRSFYAGFTDGSATEEDMIGTMMSVADSNHDGFVQYDEFERVLGGNGRGNDVNSSSSSSSSLVAVFKAMDKDGDGKLSHGDLKAYMDWAGFDSSDDDIRAMIKLGGDDSDGVSYEGLLRILGC